MHAPVDRDPFAWRDEHRVSAPTSLSGMRTLAPFRRTVAVAGRKSSRSRMARRPRPTVSPSSTSAARTNVVIINAVTNSPMASAASSAIVIDSSIVIRRSRMFSHASWKIGQPPIRVPSSPNTLRRGNGSQTRNQTAPATAAVPMMRINSNGSMRPWSTSSSAGACGASAMVPT